MRVAVSQRLQALLAPVDLVAVQLSWARARCKLGARALQAVRMQASLLGKGARASLHGLRAHRLLVQLAHSASREQEWPDFKGFHLRAFSHTGGQAGSLAAESQNWRI